MLRTRHPPSGPLARQELERRGGGILVCWPMGQRGSPLGGNNNKGLQGNGQRLLQVDPSSGRVHEGLVRGIKPGGYEFAIDRDNMLAFLGYRFLTNPSIAFCLTYDYSKADTEADAMAYGATDFDAETTHRFYGFGLLASQALGTTRFAIFGMATYSLWGTWTSKRHGLDTNREPYEFELEDDSPACYGGELGIGYRLTWINASAKASWGFQNEHIEFAYAGMDYRLKYDNRWQDLALGLSYEF